MRAINRLHRGPTPHIGVEPAVTQVPEPLDYGEGRVEVKPDLLKHEHDDMMNLTNSIKDLGISWKSSTDDNSGHLRSIDSSVTIVSPKDDARSLSQQSATFEPDDHSAREKRQEGRLDEPSGAQAHEQTAFAARHRESTSLARASA